MVCLLFHLRSVTSETINAIFSMIRLNHKGGGDMNEFKKDVLQMLSLKKNKWMELKGKEQDVTQENFVDSVILTIGWIINDIERLDANNE